MMSGTNAELIAEARERARGWGEATTFGSLTNELVDALEAAEANTESLRQVIRSATS